MRKYTCKCGKEFHDYTSNHRVYCSKSCCGKNSKTQFNKKHKGFANQKKKGGKTHNKGYVLILMPEHPNAYKPWGYIREHRIVMEHFLGRLLEPQEIVHHINGIKDDNRIENLKLFNNSREHRQEHARAKWS